MKRIFTLLLFLFLCLKISAQTDGITYQAVIIGPDVLELPGVDSEGNYLPTTTVAIRFTIFDSGNEVEFQEVQVTTTDEFGRINLIIGAVEHDDFEKISWDGTAKDLAVEIDFEGGSNFVDMSREVLTFVPYAYHRNITATGTLDVDDDTFLNRELTVNGPTNLNSTLSVNDGNETSLTGDLTVDGATNLNGTLDVNNKSTTNLSGALNVGEATGVEDVDAPTVLNGTLNVVGKTTVTDFEATGQSTFNELIANTLEVKEYTLLDSIVNIGNSNNDVINMTGGLSISSDKQINITSTVSGDDEGIGNYPMIIQGGNQGLAIKIEGNRTNANNFVSFWDTDPNGQMVGNARPSTMWGRIEGETPSEFDNNADYLFDQASLSYDIFDADLDLAWATIDIVIEGFDLAAAYTDFRPCLGFGACTTSPGFADIAASVASVALVLTKEGFAIAAKIRADTNRDNYDANKITYQGVTYASGAGDYAEYLLREHRSEKITFGDIVGVKGGKVSKHTHGAERLMVVSLKPIVLGNMPEAHKEEAYEKVAFMGQVPVKVFGKVNMGDYIIASGKNDGVGVAVNPSDISLENVKNIVGIAWEEKGGNTGFSMVNVAVGLNRNDNNPIIEKLEKKVLEQSAEINVLKTQMTKILEKLSNIEQGISPASINQTASGKKDTHDERKYEILDSPEGEIIYFEMRNEDFEHGLQMAQEQLLSEGVDLENHILWKRINNDPMFKEKLRGKLQTKFHKQLHYHKEVSKKAKH
ncbi:hypothetical protein [Flavivirga algicola]|uniref:Peptidase G2 IMC autoproteolytic cleavage domain-containing protein n=1 Tax=Flavivirga algicola TaxID=2729136 RepID=A0ABX1S1Z5_9FLAO|nr:hypothetical protein [Flavivirga algicola]NMH89391.1 hypothetical protein [Flavivirga algicola]